MEKYNKTIWTVVIVIAVVGIGFGTYYLIYKKPPAPPAPTPPAEVTEEQPAPVPAEEPISEEERRLQEELLRLGLDDSDNMVRQLAQGLSSHPQLSVWLKNEDLLRKFTAVVDNIATSSSPRSHIKFLAPKGDFHIMEKNGLTYIDPDSFNRYNLAANVFTSLDAEDCAKLYHQAKPLVQEAYQDLGYPAKDFQQTLTKAIIELLKTPLVEGDIQLEKKVITYMMVDPKLEQLSPAQKQLLRMGPENVRKIQAKLREIALALGIPESQIPQSVVYYTRKIY